MTKATILFQHIRFPEKRAVSAIVAVSFAFLSLAGCVRILRQAIARHESAHQTTAVTAKEDENVPAEVRIILQNLVQHGVPGITAIAMKDGKLIFRIDVGDIKPDTQYPVASASKWLTAGLAMTVVDEGKLSLDEPVSRRLPQFSGDAGKVTLRELLAQTSGEGNLKSAVDIKQDPRMTLAQSAADIAKRPLAHKPGAEFEYGGPGFQVAGALVETATGQRWSELFAQRIAAPLGMTHTSWEHLPAHGVAPEDTLNPLLQGGAVTTADDYMHFLTMLANKGTYEGHRVLSEKAVDTMETVQTLGLPVGFEPRGVTPEMKYALGNWCAAWDDDRRCRLVMSPGAFGTFPWLDRDSGVYGIFFMKARLPDVASQLRQAMRAIIITNK